MHLPLLERKRDPYLISSNPSLLSLSAISAAFDSDLVYWNRQSLPQPVLRATLDNSYNLGLYYSPPKSDSSNNTIHSEAALPAQKDHDVVAPAPSSSPSSEGTARAQQQQQVGLARLITDHLTFAYLTDVYVLEEHQGKGLGKWLVECVEEVLRGMPYLRRAMLVTGKGKGERLYERYLGGAKAEVQGSSAGESEVDEKEHETVVMTRFGPGRFMD